ncbi:transcriptional regulator, IclR family [Sphingobium sp. AP50]|uniref:IclR family transcriptional regulator n=1 Tax=Sphingobium sp. AP50 TaxID=1884369 RepID=UPI0008D58256|nr:IclR family transcriptional regulator [Sphingobium sp. AP50]SEK07209.1 transcriptional regulator, IclR family [Sphingobium sp. AP50]
MVRDNDSSGTQVIARAAAVLKTLEGESKGLTIAEITRVSDLPRTTVQRIVNALQAQQLVVTVDGRIRLGPTLTRLAGSTHLDVIGIARPHLEILNRQIDETVNLSVLRGNHAVLVDQVASGRELRVVSAVGSALPLYCTAHGKALLAEMPDREIEERLSGEWERKTPSTVSSMAELWPQLASIRQVGVAFDEEEHLEGVDGVGAVLDTGTAERYAISVALPSVRFARAQEVISEKIHFAATAISACF